MVRKNDVFNIFKIFQLHVERQFDIKIKQVQSDWGGEFRFLSTFFKSIGIHHRTSCPHTSEQNGTVERRHPHVVDTGQASLPFKYWHFAFETTVYLINCMPTRVLNNDSPYYCLFQTQPNYHFLKFSGCLCFMYLALTIPTKCHSDPFNIFFSGIVPLIMATGVLILNPIVFTLPAMFGLMKIIFPFQNPFYPS